MSSLSPQPNFDDQAESRHWYGAVSACVYAVFVLGISAGFLFCNSLTSFVIYSAIPQSKDRVLMGSISQLFFYLMPIALTFLQWYLIDRLLRFMGR